MPWKGPGKVMYQKHLLNHKTLFQNLYTANSNPKQTLYGMDFINISLSEFVSSQYFISFHFISCSLQVYRLKIQADSTVSYKPMKGAYLKLSVWPSKVNA